MSLNPCCNGICSKTLETLTVEQFKRVLILVVMEYALRLRTDVSAQAM